MQPVAGRSLTRKEEPTAYSVFLRLGLCSLLGLAAER
jgi:hypothetical protein